MIPADVETRQFTPEEIAQVREAIRKVREDIDEMYRVDPLERFIRMNTPIGPGRRGWPHQRRKTQFAGPTPPACGASSAVQ